MLFSFLILLSIDLLINNRTPFIQKNHKNSNKDSGSNFLYLQPWLRVLSYNIYWWFSKNLENRWWCFNNFLDPQFCMLYFSIKFLLSHAPALSILTNIYTFILQDEKFELCRFSKDGTKPFLFCTVQKGMYKSW